MPAGLSREARSGGSQKAARTLRQVHTKDHPGRALRELKTDKRGPSIKSNLRLVAVSDLAMLNGCLTLHAQLIDNTQAPNTAKAGINKSLLDEIGAGRGDPLTPNSSIYIINRDPYRSIRRGRQLFQRKFTRAQGQGPGEGDGVGDINTDIAIGAGLSDSCASCHSLRRRSC